VSDNLESILILKKKIDPQSNFSFPDNLESNFSLQTDIFNSIWVDHLVSTAFFTGNPELKLTLKITKSQNSLL
jgi:hypothetical protein